MTDIDTLLQLNVEIEGLLRVLRDRDSIHARSALSEKFKKYSDALTSYLGTPAPTEAETADMVEQAADMAAHAQAEEVKDQEAVDTEVVPETDAATEAIEKAPQTPADSAVNERLLKAFTLNDRFRFRRELFNGDDEDFTDTIALLAHMPDYAEATDYLINDLLWDSRNEAVKDFFAILKENMPST